MLIPFMSLTVKDCKSMIRTRAFKAFSYFIAYCRGVENYRPTGSKKVFVLWVVPNIVAEKTFIYWWMKQIRKTPTVFQRKSLLTSAILWSHSLPADFASCKLEIHTISNQKYIQ